MTVNQPGEHKKPKRLTCIDETRALAIISMIIMHFGPGVFDRLPQLSFLAEPVLFLGRFATTTFIVVFGITLGFVYFDKFQGETSKKITKALFKRARFLMLCSIIICVPNYINLAIAGDYQFAHWMFNTYSILNYYTLALLSVPFWLWALQSSRPMLRCTVLGLAHWGLASLILIVWPLDPSLGIVEYVRMHVASGPYGYLQMSGTAIMAIPVGYTIRRALQTSQGIRPVLLQLIPLGTGLAMAGFGLGMYLEEFSIGAIVEGTVKTPPRFWYFLFFGGFALILLSGMGFLGMALGRFSKITYPLSLFGQASLAIYTGHRYVLPSLGWMDACGVQIEGIARIAFPFVLFAIFCAYMMIRVHRKSIKPAKSRTKDATTESKKGWQLWLARLFGRKPTTIS